MLPFLRTRLRKEDKLSINGAGIVTVVIRAEQHGAEIVAQRIKTAVESTPVRVGVRNREVKVNVTYSSLTFASKASDGSVRVSGPLVDESMVAALIASEE